MKKIIKYLLVCAFAVTAFQVTADCRTAQDKTTLRKKVFFQKGRTTAILKNTIRRGTNHQYLLRASEGQSMILHLAAKQSGLTLYKPNGGEAIEDADGVNDWTGTLPESGEYTIEVATDAKATPYTLEVTIR